MILEPFTNSLATNGHELPRIIAAIKSRNAANLKINFVKIRVNSWLLSDIKIVLIF